MSLSRVVRTGLLLMENLIHDEKLEDAGCVEELIAVYFDAGARPQISRYDSEITDFFTKQTSKFNFQVGKDK